MLHCRSPHPLEGCCHQAEDHEDRDRVSAGHGAGPRASAQAGRAASVAGSTTVAALARPRHSDVSDVGRSGAMAYVFMTDAPHFVDYSAEPEGGENAVIVQPDGRPPHVQRAYRDVPTPIRVCSDAEGPTIGPDHVMVEQPLPPNVERTMQFLWGEPEWMHAEDLAAVDWRLVVQLDATTLPLLVNFGDGGIGYAFVDPTGIEGRFLWQCS